MTHKNLSFSDIKRLKRWVNTYEVFTFPYQKEDIKVWIRVLSQDEITQCSLEAKNRAEAYIRNKIWSDDIQKFEQTVIGDLWLRELLYRACIVPWSDDNEKFFSSVDEVADMSIDEHGLLMEYYESVQEKYAPVKSLENPKDFEELIDDLKKKWLSGMSLNTYTARKLLSYLIVNIETSQNDNGTTYTLSNQSEEKKNQDKWIEPKIQTELISIEKE